jgi:hypothetical protein
MTRCLICSAPISGARLETDDGSVHPACLAERLPQDAIVALLAAVGLMFAYTAIVMAG